MERCGAAWLNPPLKRTASTLAQAAPVLSSCATVRNSWCDNLGQAAASTAEAAAAKVHAECVGGALSLHRRRSAQRRG